jgi:hypothetical protein
VGGWDKCVVVGGDGEVGSNGDRDGKGRVRVR